MGDYASVEQIAAAAAQDAREAEAQRKKHAEYTTARDTLHAGIEKARLLVEQLPKLSEQRVMTETQAQRTKERLMRMNQLSGLIDARQEKRMADERAQSDARRAIEAKMHAQQEYILAEAAFFGAQAGVLAEKLEEGEACPVCGSREHPAPAKRQEHAPTQAQLDALRMQREKAEQRAVAVHGQAQRTHAALEAVEEQTKEMAVELLGACQWDTLAQVVCTESAQMKKCCEELAEQAQQQAQRIKKLQNTQSLIPEKEKEEQELAKAQLDSAARMAQLEAQAAEKAQQASRMREALPYPDRKTAKAHMDALATAREEILKEIERTERDARSAQERLTRLAAQEQTLLKQLESAGEETVLAQLNEERGALAQRTERLQEQLRVLHARIAQNKETLVRMEKGQEAVNKRREISRIVQSLANTASGQVSGKGKVTLETYVQMAFFDRVIDRANLRLGEMTGGQYALRRKAEADNLRTQAGLDMEVIDHANGTARDVRTLSGGESFKASLALALGLSDEIQSGAGGVRLDTLFVDEGFGSLDGQSLEQAMGVLASLTQGRRLVGIISHVEELSRRIEKKVIVSKDRTGVSRVRIVCE